MVCQYSRDDQTNTDVCKRNKQKHLHLHETLNQSWDSATLWCYHVVCQLKRKKKMHNQKVENWNSCCGTVGLESDGVFWVAVRGAGSIPSLGCSRDSIPGLGTSICYRWGHKVKKNDIYVWFVKHTEDLSPGDSLSDRSEGLFWRGWGGAGIHGSFCNKNLVVGSLKDYC